MKCDDPGHDHVDMKQWAKDHKRKFDFAQAIYRALLVFDVGIGIAILAGGVERFPFPSYQPLLDLSGGESWPWGVVIMLCGVLMALHGWWVNMAALGLSLLWLNMFSVMFWVAIVKYPSAGSTAPIPYMCLAMIVVALMTYKIIERRIRVLED